MENITHNKGSPSNRRNTNNKKSIKINKTKNYKTCHNQQKQHNRIYSIHN